VDLDHGEVLIAGGIGPRPRRVPGGQGDQDPTPNAALPSPPTPLSCCAPIGSPKPRTRWPAGPRSPPTAMCSRTLLMARPDQPGRHHPSLPPPRATTRRALPWG
jgi:hypothetical protein